MVATRTTSPKEVTGERRNSLGSNRCGFFCIGYRLGSRQGTRKHYTDEGGIGGSSTFAWQRLSFSVGAVGNPPGEPEFYMELSGNVSGGTAANQQIFADFPVEDVRVGANSDVTFSVYLHGSSTGTVGVQLVQFFGTGGSAYVPVAGQNISVTTTWKRYTLTFAAPSISGKTIGTGSHIRIRVYKQAGSAIQASVGLPTTINYTGNLHIWGVQLDLGSTATAFERRPIALEQRLLERYFFRFPDGNLYSYVGTGDIPSTTYALILVQVPVTMRTAPTFSYGGSWGVIFSGTGVGLSSISVLVNDGYALVLQANLSSAISSAYVGHAALLRHNSDANAYMQLDARF